MKKIIRKAFMDFEKEENWINHMAREGWAMTDYAWCRYAFESCEPGAYVYRIELLPDLAGRPKSRSYVEFVESTGAQEVANYGRWVYFRKKSGEGNFDLFSDLGSRLAHYRRVFQFWVVLAIAELLIGFSNVSTGLGNLAAGRSGTNLYMGLPLLLIGFLMLFGLVLPIRRKMALLKKEQDIRE